MKMNHPPGADRSRPARSHGRRKRAADTRVRVVPSNAKSLAQAPAGLGGYFRPLFLPDAVVGAVALSVAAVFHRRLPELDAFEICARGVRVVPAARALLDLFHERAGPRVCLLYTSPSPR